MPAAGAGVDERQVLGVQVVGRVLVPEDHDHRGDHAEERPGRVRGHLRGAGGARGVGDDEPFVLAARVGHVRQPVLDRDDPLLLGRLQTQHVAHQEPQRVPGFAQPGQAEGVDEQVRVLQPGEAFEQFADLHGGGQQRGQCADLAEGAHHALDLDVVALDDGDHVALADARGPQAVGVVVDGLRELRKGAHRTVVGAPGGVGEEGRVGALLGGDGGEHSEGRGGLGYHVEVECGYVGHSSSLCSAWLMLSGSANTALVRARCAGGSRVLLKRLEAADTR